MTDEPDLDVRSVPCPVPLYRWLPVDALLPEMTLAHRVIGQAEGRTTIMLAAGTILTTSTISQLILKAIECVAIVNQQPPEIGDYLVRQQAYEARLRVIFDCAEGFGQGCRPLFDALVVAGPML